MKLFNLIKKFTFIPIFFIFVVCYTLLIYFNILKTNNQLYSIINFGLNILFVFILSFLILRKKQKKGIVYGFIVGISYSVIILIFCIISKTPVNINLIIKLLSAVFTCIFSGILSVNTKK